MFRSIDYSLYVITDERVDFQLSLRVVEKAIKGGATVVQFRNKNASTKVLVGQGIQLLALTKKFNIPLIVNDRLDVALAIGVDGVHLGQDDMPIEIARRILNQSVHAYRYSGRLQNLTASSWLGQDLDSGRARSSLARMTNNNFIIGASVKTAAQAKQAEKDGADYLGAGDIFGTKTKKDAGEPIGIIGLTRIVQSVSIPVVGIGGINSDNAADVIKAGAKGVAVISVISRAKEPEKAARELLAEINEGIKNYE